MVFTRQICKAPIAKTGPPRLKVRKLGNSLGVVLSKDVLALLKAGEGDFLSVTETPEGVVLNRIDTDIRAQIEAGRKAMQRYRNALRELAK